MALKVSILNLIASEDFVELSIRLITDEPDVLKTNIKTILNKCRSKDKIPKLLSALVSILNNDISLWKLDNAIKMVFNELEEESVKLLSLESDKGSAQKFYDIMVEKQFEIMFDNLRKYLEKLLQTTEIDPSFYHMSATLINFTKLIDIRGYEAILYPMARFADILLTKFIEYEVLHPLTVDFVVHINHRLINYLAVTPGSAVSKGLREAISIYEAVRTSIINMTFTQPEVINSALNILEHRSRFFGLNADAIPENENHGSYIVIDPLNAPFEDDDVYDDYEKFLATLPS